MLENFDDIMGPHRGGIHPRANDDEEARARQRADARRLLASALQEVCDTINEAGGMQEHLVADVVHDVCEGVDLGVDVANTMMDVMGDGPYCGWLVTAAAPGTPRAFLIAPIVDDMAAPDLTAFLTS